VSLDHLEDRLPLQLVCPRDHEQLARTSGGLACSFGHVYPVENGVPVFLLDETKPTQPSYWATCEESIPADELPDPGPDEIDPYVLSLLLGTCGNLYRGLTNLPRYPIPDLELPPGEGAMFLELGSNWGRWCLSASRSGYRAVGIDPSLGAIRAANRVSRQLGVPAAYVVADSRHLPFPSESVDVVFSYSVLQHFAPRDVEATLEEVARVLKKDGLSVHQMPNAYGLWNLAQQVRRGFKPAQEFNVRYWRPRDLMRLFDTAIGPTTLSVDGFLSLNPRLGDLDLLPRSRRYLLRLSAWLERQAQVVRPLGKLADSLYVISSRRAG
jgi:SAM-dependent methyltransferase